MVGKNLRTVLDHPGSSRTCPRKPPRSDPALVGCFCPADQSADPQWRVPLTRGCRAPYRQRLRAVWGSGTPEPRVAGRTSVAAGARPPVCARQGGARSRPVQVAREARREVHDSPPWAAGRWQFTSPTSTLTPACRRTCRKPPRPCTAVQLARQKRPFRHPLAHITRTCTVSLATGPMAMDVRLERRRPTAAAWARHQPRVRPRMPRLAVSCESRRQIHELGDTLAWLASLVSTVDQFHIPRRVARPLSRRVSTL
jgi:hypothetical protein